MRLNLIPFGVMPVMYINQYDFGIEKTFEIYKGSEKFLIPSGYTVTLRATKPDHYGITVGASFTAGQNVVSVTIPQQLTAVPGNVIAELVFANSSSVRVGTINMVIRVEPAALADGTVISDSDISYAEEVLSELQSISAFGERMNVVEQKTIGIVTPQMYGAKGDGITDDTNAIQDCFNSMVDGSCFYLPKGVYVITQVSTKNISGARYIFDGTLKLKDNIQTPYGMFVLNGTHCIVDGLKIDGNVENSIDEESYGVSCALLLNTDTEKNTIQNVYIHDTTYCACISNQGVSDYTFSNFVFSNIGEHCFYIGGSGSNRLLFENIKAYNIGMNSHNASSEHECYIVKIKESDCDVATLNNVVLQQNISPPTTVHVLLGLSKNLLLDGCIALSYATSLCVIRNTIENLLIVNSYSDRYAVYGDTAENKNKSNIRIVNSIIGRLNGYVEYVREYVNCTIKSMSTRSRILQAKLAPTYFNGCTFITSGTAANWADFSYLNCDYYFINCKFINARESGGSYAIVFGGHGAQSNTTIVMDGVTFEDTTYSYNMFANDKNINVRIMNSILNKISFFKVNFLQLFNLQWESAYKFSTSGLNDITLSSFDKVFKNWNDVSGTL